MAQAYGLVSAYASSNLAQLNPKTDHCADIVRQKLMCDSDVNIVAYNWIEGHLSPHPNFNVQHRCRDFDAVRQYAYDHRITIPYFSPNGYLLRPTDKPVVEFHEPPVDPMADA